MNRVVALVRRIVPGVQAASVTVLGHGRIGVRTAGSTGGVAVRLDETQYRLGEGPCLRAAATGAVVSVPDTATDTLFPGFSAEACRVGVRESLSLPLPQRGEGTAPGSLNLYSQGTSGFDLDSVALAEVFAEEASLTLSDGVRDDDLAAQVEHLRTAMVSRATIEMAKGVLMGQLRCGPDAAFAELRRRSGAENRKLRDVAAGIVRACSDATVEQGGPAL